MIARTAIIVAASAVLPLSAVARPHDAAPAARDVQDSQPAAAKRDSVAAVLIDHIRSAEETVENNILVKESLSSALDQTITYREDDDGDADEDDTTKGKGSTGYHGSTGGYGYGGGSGNSAATTTGGRPAAGFALVVGVAAVVVSSLVN
ncbi:hypothetical protein MN608_09321 [Microdochium nivale]|nr:hypothetical protein MN608_09321 [Microdochium nivale]